MPPNKPSSEPKKPPGRGGVRPGAGRPLGPTGKAKKNTAFRLDGGTLALLDRLAADRGLSRPTVLAAALMHLDLVWARSDAARKKAP